MTGQDDGVATEGRYSVPELSNGTVQSQCLTCWTMVRRGDEPAHDRLHGLSQPSTGEASPQ